HVGGAADVDPTRRDAGDPVDAARRGREHDRAGPDEDAAHAALGQAAVAGDGLDRGAGPELGDDLGPLDARQPPGVTLAGPALQAAFEAGLPLALLALVAEHGRSLKGGSRGRWRRKRACSG